MGRSHGSQWGWVRGWWRFPGRPSMTLGELLWVSTTSTIHTLTVHETIPGQMRWTELEVPWWMPPRRGRRRRRRRRRKGTLSRNLGHVRTALSNGSERPKYQKLWSVITWFFKQWIAAWKWCQHFRTHWDYSKMGRDHTRGKSRPIFLKQDVFGWSLLWFMINLEYNLHSMFPVGVILCWLCEMGVK